MQESYPTYIVSEQCGTLYVVISCGNYEKKVIFSRVKMFDLGKKGNRSKLGRLKLVINSDKWINF